MTFSSHWEEATASLNGEDTLDVLEYSIGSDDGVVEERQ